MNSHQVNEQTQDPKSDEEGVVKKMDERRKPSTGKFDDGECAVCLVSPQVDKSFPPCQHTFCFECLANWCKLKRDCPTCKQGIVFFDHENGRKRYFPPAESDETNETTDDEENPRDIRWLTYDFTLAYERVSLIANRDKCPTDWLENRIRCIDEILGR